MVRNEGNCPAPYSFPFGGSREPASQKVSCLGGNAMLSHGFNIGAVDIDGDRLHDLIDIDDQTKGVLLLDQRAFPSGEGAVFHADAVSNS